MSKLAKHDFAIATWHNFLQDIKPSRHVFTFQTLCVMFRNYSFSYYSVVAADRLSFIGEFHVVLEDDGSVLCDVLDTNFWRTKKKLGH